jgi:hypothetical protein
MGQALAPLCHKDACRGAANRCAATVGSPPGRAFLELRNCVARDRIGFATPQSGLPIPIRHIFQRGFRVFDRVETREEWDNLEVPEF